MTYDEALKNYEDACEAAKLANQKLDDAENVLMSIAESEDIFLFKVDEG